MRIPLPKEAGFFVFARRLTKAITKAMKCFFIRFSDI